MGLDMYLTRREYVKNWDDKAPHTEVVVKRDGAIVKTKLKAKEVVYEAAYWRKANAIHNWFVNNTQGGDDQNGQEVWVSREQLQELLDLCKEVVKIAKLGKGKVQNGSTYNHDLQKWVPIMEEGVTVLNPEEVAELLPPTEGFFFGSTEVDGWFIRDVKDTIEQLTVALEEEGGEFYYEGNW